jgi:hypothetical protein
MKRGSTIALLFLTLYAFDHEIYGGKLTRAAQQVAGQMVSNFR